MYWIWLTCIGKRGPVFEVFSATGTADQSPKGLPWKSRLSKPPQAFAAADHVKPPAIRMKGLDVLGYLLPPKLLQFSLRADELHCTIVEQYQATFRVVVIERQQLRTTVLIPARF